MATLDVAREIATAAGEDLRNIHIFQALVSLPEGQHLVLEPEEAHEALTAELTSAREPSAIDVAQTPRTKRLLAAVHPPLPINLLHGLLADAGNGEIAELLDRHHVTSFKVPVNGEHVSIPNTFVLEQLYTAISPDTGVTEERQRGERQSGEAS